MRRSTRSGKTASSGKENIDNSFSGNEENDQSVTWKSVGSVSPASPFAMTDSPFRFPVMGTPAAALLAAIVPGSEDSGGLSPRARMLSPGALSPCVTATPVPADGLATAEAESPVTPDEDQGKYYGTAELDAASRKERSLALSFSFPRMRIRREQVLSYIMATIGMFCITIGLALQWHAASLPRANSASASQGQGQGRQHQQMVLSRPLPIVDTITKKSAAMAMAMALTPSADTAGGSSNFDNVLVLQWLGLNRPEEGRRRYPHILPQVVASSSALLVVSNSAAYPKIHAISSYVRQEPAQGKRVSLRGAAVEMGLMSPPPSPMMLLSWSAAPKFTSQLVQPLTQVEARVNEPQQRSSNQQEEQQQEEPKPQHRAHSQPQPQQSLEQAQAQTQTQAQAQTQTQEEANLLSTQAQAQAQAQAPFAFNTRRAPGQPPLTSREKLRWLLAQRATLPPIGSSAPRFDQPVSLSLSSRSVEVDAGAGAGGADAEADADAGVTATMPGADSDRSSALAAASSHRETAPDRDAAQGSNLQGSAGTATFPLRRLRSRSQSLAGGPRGPRARAVPAAGPQTALAVTHPSGVAGQGHGHGEPATMMIQAAPFSVVTPGLALSPFGHGRQEGQEGQEGQGGQIQAQQSLDSLVMARYWAMGEDEIGGVAVAMAVAATARPHQALAQPVALALAQPQTQTQTQAQAQAQAQTTTTPSRSNTHDKSQSQSHSHSHSHSHSAKPKHSPRVSKSQDTTSAAGTGTGTAADPAQLAGEGALVRQRFQSLSLTPLVALAQALARTALSHVLPTAMTACHHLLFSGGQQQFRERVYQAGRIALHVMGGWRAGAVSAAMNMVGGGGGGKGGEGEGLARGGASGGGGGERAEAPSKSNKGHSRGTANSTGTGTGAEGAKAGPAGQEKEDENEDEARLGLGLKAVAYVRRLLDPRVLLEGRREAVPATSVVM